MESGLVGDHHVQSLRIRLGDLLEKKRVDVPINGRGEQQGETLIDNNLAENSIRPTAIGKKNWLFIGHPDAGL
jgi:hypothetical protein